jgi:hypothetical protein
MAPSSSAVRISPATPFEASDMRALLGSLDVGPRSLTRAKVIAIGVVLALISLISVAAIQLARHRHRGDVPVERGPNDDPNMSDDEIVRRRTDWFRFYTAQGNVFAPAGAEPYTCPCCGQPTLTERGSYEICSECDWEDDGQDDHDSSVVRGGPNGALSLDAARVRYESGGRRRGSHVSPAVPE